MAVTEVSIHQNVNLKCLIAGKYAEKKRQRVLAVKVLIIAENSQKPEEKYPSSSDREMSKENGQV